MIWVESAMWLAVALLLYTYLGYPIVLIAVAAAKQVITDLHFVLRSRTRRVGDVPGRSLPSVAVLIAAHNEETHIVRRIENLLRCDYPPERLRIYVGSDGSTDRTNALAEAIGSDRLQFFPFAARRGKPSVVNDLAASATEDILVLTDANTYFSVDAIKLLVRHFDDAEVGCVCGELRLTGASSGNGQNPDGVYWKYERVLKFYEGRLGALLGANGGIYAVRRLAYRPIPSNTIVDDFHVSVEVIKSGLRCQYEPEAKADEESPPSIGDEFRRRVRIGVGNYQAMVAHLALLDPRRGFTAVAFFSHKVLRWIAPHLMIAVFFTNAAALGEGGVYYVLMLSQIAFYLLAAFGYALASKRKIPSMVRLPTFFVSMNAALLVGFLRYLKGNMQGTWTRSTR